MVRAGLAADNPDIIEVLRSLDTGATRHPVVWHDGRWYARNADAGITASVPAALRARVSAGQPSAQRVRTPYGVALAIGLPIDDSTQFYVLDSLSELDQTLRVLSLVLTFVAAGTTAAGGLLGAYVTRRVLRPLTQVANAASTISAGHLETRLDPAAEPELAHLADSFNSMVDQLSARMERDRRFAADVSHELRSPLQTLSAAAAVLGKRRDHVDSRTGRALDLLTGEIKRFTDLVTDLLELARSDQPPERIDTDVAELARQACRARGVPADVVRVDNGTRTRWSVDRRRLEQVLANLLDNAASHGGGAIAVRVSCADGLGVIEVDDEGPGVAPEDRSSIFDRFTRGAGARARGDSEGAGLGLALVAEHVAAHGGRVEVMDRPGGGARFRIEIPKQER